MTTQAKSKISIIIAISGVIFTIVGFVFTGGEVFAQAKNTEKRVTKIEDRQTDFEKKFDVFQTEVSNMSSETKLDIAIIKLSLDGLTKKLDEMNWEQKQQHNETIKTIKQK